MIDRIRSFFAKENGVSLVEAIVSIAIISFVSVGVTTLLFFNARTTKLAEKQSHERDIAKIVKENVVASAKTGNPIYGNGTSDIVTKDYTGTDLRVYDIKDNYYDNYTFDIKWDSSPEGAMYSLYKYNTYNIKIKDSSGVIIMTFNIDIYSDR